MTAALKLTGLILLLSAGGYAVYKRVISANNRISFLRYMISDIEFLLNEITFLNSTVGKALERLKETGTKNADLYGKILKETGAGLTLYDSFLGSFDKIRCPDARDFEIVAGVFAVLGKTDFEGQRRSLEGAEELLKARLSQAEAYRREELKAKCATLLFAFVLIGIILL